MKKEIIKDEKLKPLRPSLRVKKRFLRIRINSERKFNYDEISKNISSHLLKFLGVIDFGDSSFWILKDYFNFNKQEIIFKVSLNQFNKVSGILFFLDNIEGEKVSIDLLKVSGTIKGVLRD